MLIPYIKILGGDEPMIKVLAHRAVDAAGLGIKIARGLGKK